MKTGILIASLFLSSTQLFAATFVGSGGNTSDNEFVATVRQIQDTLNLSVARQNETEAVRPVCQCTPALQNSAICKSLTSLDEAERTYCEKTYKSNVQALARLIESDSLKFNWTNQEILVKENGVLRAVEAVADTKSSVVTVNQKQFKGLSQQERVFLLAHEIFHFGADGKRALIDEGSYGPFKGEDGGRRLVNALAAATVMESERLMTAKKYKWAMRRQGWRKIWIDLGVGASSTSAESDATFNMESYTQAGLNFRYYFTNNLGIAGTVKTISGTQDFFDETKGTENLTAAGVGPTFRWFPFNSKPYSWIGQTHLVTSAYVQSVNSKYVLDDGFVKEEDETSFIGYSLDAKYYFPIFKFTWAHVGGDLVAYNYGHEKIGTDYDGLRYNLTVGVSCGF
jgi:predicted metallopeptidase